MITRMVRNDIIREDAPRASRSVLMGLFFLFSFLPAIGRAQTDSIRYEPTLGHYLRYERDSIGQWRLKEVWDKEAYLAYRARKMGFSTFPFGKKTITTDKAKAPKLSFSVNGTFSLNLSTTQIEDDNPALNSMMRRRSFIDMVQQSNINVAAKYGDHLRLDLQYNTETGIEARKARLKLQYSGDEFDFIQRLEAGNIRMDSYNPLIDVGSDLFGLSGVFRAGPLELKVIASRQRDSERKIMIRGGQQIRYFEVKGSHYDYAKHFFLSEYFARRYDEALSALPLVNSRLHIDRVEVWVSSATVGIRRSDTESVEAFTHPSIEGSTPPDASMLTGPSTPIRGAVKLPEQAYTLNPTLGYISLHAPLADDQLLAVVYSYHIDDKAYQVGTFGAEDGAVRAALIAERTKSPDSPLWGLMMKNAYSLPGGAQDITPDDLTAQILYRNPRTNNDEHAITNGPRRGKAWSTLFGWDVTNSARTGDHPDGLFDFIEGATLSTSSGTLFLPSRTPFVTIPRRANGGGDSPYPPYSILYEKTQTEAERASAMDRFVIRGSLKSNNTQVIHLGSTRLLPGSITARQGARQLQEGTDYVVDYNSGDLTLKAHIQGDVEVTIREREAVRSKEKNIVGAEANIDLLPGLSVGGTILNYTEQSHLMRVRMGEEPLNNLLWGLHANYKISSMRWTDHLRQLTSLNLSAPSSLELHASYASLSSKYNTEDGQIVLEDFEQSGIAVDLTIPQPWRLGSDPMRATAPSQDDERGQMAWFMIDPLLVREGAVNQPAHLRDDPMARANPLVREVHLSELFPQRDRSPYQNNDLPTLSISFYPNERGPYNTSTKDLRADGTLDRPREKWGAMMRPLEVHDFERERIAYFEGWLLDPTYYDDTTNEGMLWIDLGQLSEEILPDHLIDAEGTMPTTDTEYGKAPLELPRAYTFDRTGNIPISRQDRGLNGLTSDEERTYTRYKDYLRTVEHLTGFKPWETHGTALPGHPFEDPAGDDYHFFLGEEWDRSRAGILARYKYINGTEGNSTEEIIQGQQSIRHWEPDVEDLDRDFALQEEENFFRYALPISRDGLRVDGEHIVAERILTHAMPDGTTMRSRWIKVRLPLLHPTIRQGNPRWQDIRAIRLSLSGFERPIHLRWAMMRLVAMPWRPFESAIDAHDRRTAELSVSTIGVEEESAKEPIPYVTPPGVERERMASVAMVRQDEKALAMEVKDLEQGQAAAVYQTVKYDLRHYRELSLFSHLEARQTIMPGRLELFIRLGSDFTDNYYEYRIPLEQTQATNFEGLSTAQLQQLVWPQANHLRIPLSQFTELKRHRNNNGYKADKLLLMPDGQNAAQTIGIKGYPTLADITGVMIGIRSKDEQTLSAEVWIDELSVSGAGALGGDALLVGGKAAVSDLLTIEGDGGYRSAGFGGLQSDARKSELSDHRHYNIRGRLELKHLFPTSWAVHAPITFATSYQSATPKYDPYASDLAYTAAEGIHRVGSMYRTDQWTLPDWHIGKDTKATPTLFAPSNLRFSYALQRTHEESPEVASRFARMANTDLSYSYEPKAGNYLRLSSNWNRQFLFTRFAEGDDAGHSFAGRWDWRRALHLRWMPWRWLTLGMESTTTAMIMEPFEDEYLHQGTPRFRLLTNDILRSILNLGETMNANSRTELSLNLPHQQLKGLSPLSGTLTWRSNYSWTRGVSTSAGFGGHRISNSGYLDLNTSYRFSELFSTQAEAPVQLLALHLRHTTGSSLPSFLPSAGKAMGLGSYERAIAPTLGYMLALGSNEEHIRHAFDHEWILSDESTLFRRPSYYSRTEGEGQLTLTPLPGLHIDLLTRYLHHRHTTLQPATDHELNRQVSGTIRLSTIGLKDFFADPITDGDHHSDLSDQLASSADDSASLSDAFVHTYTLNGRLHDGLPALSMLLPNWNITYDLTQSLPVLTRFVQNLTLKHNYRGYIEYPNYRYGSDGNTTPTPHTIVHLDEMSPLMGIEAKFDFGLEWEERYTRRRTTTLLVTSARMLEQLDRELYTSVRYHITFPALFHSDIPLLRSSRQELRFNLNHIYAHGYLLTHNLTTRYTAATQGLDSHALNTSVEYSFSQSLSLRAFIEQERRKPLVSNLTYPYRRTTYGLLLLLHLTP